MSDITILSVTRSVLVQSAPGSSGAENSVSAGLFQENLSAAGEIPPFLFMSATTLQESLTPDVSGNVIFGNGVATYSLNVVAPIGSFLARSDSLFNATFTVDANGQYRLTSSVEWNGEYTPFGGLGTNLAELILLENGQPLHVVSRNGNDQGTITGTNDFTFEAGKTYSITASARAFGSTLEIPAGDYAAIAGWEFELAALPMFGDVNLDGVVNLLDVDPFIDRIITGDYQVEADTNQDGAVNLLDVDPFVAILTGG